MTETARRPPEDELEVAPYTWREMRVHLAGGVLNALCTLGAVVWLAAAWSERRPSWPWVVLAVAAGMFAADLLSGLLHWAFDTWFDTSIAFVRRMVIQVREHHIYPHRIFKISFTHDAGTLSWIALLLTGPVLLWALLGEGATSGPSFYAVCTAVVFSPLLVFMLEFHKCGHRARNPAWVRLLQGLGLVLPVRHHIRHHSGNHDVNYCLINGWADLTLGRLGFFRLLERLISRLTGAQPQRDDHAWLRRYGRRVVGGAGGGEPAA